MHLRPFLQGFGVIAIILTLAPLIAADKWWIRVFDFPHLQLSLLTLLALGFYFFRFKFKGFRDYIFTTALLACFIFQFSKIYRYTRFASPQVVNTQDTVNAISLKVLTANVLQSNQEHQKLVSEIHRLNPDLLVLTETDRRWMEAINGELSDSYPYQLAEPLDNTYGMCLYSKLKLSNSKIMCLADDSIPSIHTRIELAGGRQVQLYAIHPTPPMPQHNPSSTDRDAELMIVAEKALASSLPVIVMGDFNDVAWSHTTRLFQHVGRLLDVRAGRGFYNTFNAKNFLMRWPLDHIFVSREFTVDEVQRGEDIGSDHYPYYAKLRLPPVVPTENQPELPSAEDLNESEEQIKKEAKKDSIKKSGN